MFDFLCLIILLYTMFSCLIQCKWQSCIQAFVEQYSIVCVHSVQYSVDSCKTACCFLCAAMRSQVRSLQCADFQPLAKLPPVRLQNLRPHSITRFKILFLCICSTGNPTLHTVRPQAQPVFGRGRMVAGLHSQCWMWLAPKLQ